MVPRPLHLQPPPRHLHQLHLPVQHLSPPTVYVEYRVVRLVLDPSGVHAALNLDIVEAEMPGVEPDVIRRSALAMVFLRPRLSLHHPASARLPA